MVAKIISWESWNEREKDILKSSQQKENEENNDDDDEFEEDGAEDLMSGMGIFQMSLDTPKKEVITPFGVFRADSPFKPTDRWDCWIGHTNFAITKPILKILNTKIDGISAISVLDKYTFAIGVAKMFNMRDIIKQINLEILGKNEV